jgi:hypothetical protein
MGYILTTMPRTNFQMNGHLNVAIRRTVLLLGLLCMLPVMAQVEITDPAPSHHFGKIPLGETYSTQYFSLFNRGNTPVSVGQVRVDGNEVAVCMAIGCPTIAPIDFVVGAGVGCSGLTLAPGAGCSTLISFVPTVAGDRVARLVFPVSEGNTTTRIIAGTGVSQPFDCVLDWAEQQFKTVLTNPTPTFLISPFYARCYQGGAICLGADSAVPSFAPASVYLYQNKTLQSLGFLSDFASMAKCQ